MKVCAISAYSNVLMQAITVNKQIKEEERKTTTTITEDNDKSKLIEIGRRKRNQREGVMWCAIPRKSEIRELPLATLEHVVCFDVSVLIGQTPAEYMSGYMNTGAMCWRVPVDDFVVVQVG